MKKRLISFALWWIWILWIFLLSFIITHYFLPERISQSFNDTFTYWLSYKQNIHENDVVIVKIDDYTLDNFSRSDLGMFALDKWVYAQVIENIFSQYNAAMIWVDIVFANPSVLWKEDEKKLQGVLEKYADKTVIATHSSATPHPLCLYSQVPHGAVNFSTSSTMRNYIVSYGNYNIWNFCSDAENKENIWALWIEVLQLWKNLDWKLQEKIQNWLEKVWENKQDNFFLNYFYNGEKNIWTLGFKSYSFLDIYNGEKVSRDEKIIDLEGKIVLIWEVGTLIQDSHFTPVSSDIRMPGVEIHANAITTILQQKQIRAFSLLWECILYWFLAIILLVSSFKLKIVFSVLVLWFEIFLVILLWLLLFSSEILVDMFLVILWLVFLYAALYLYRYIVTDKAKRGIKKQFSLYVSPDVVHDITQNPKSLILQGEEKMMSIFFSDIVWFTGISEKIQPTKLVQLLNEYFSEMTHIIHTNKGTLDKYIWDAVMCFFNAPLDLENHSFYACKTALMQQKRLRELSQTWQKEWFPDIKIRIWIHTGVALHGNIWSSESRVNYTIIGDSVNLASRLEAICKTYGISICVSGDVYELQKESFYFRQLDEISVKWRQAPVKIYQLIWEKHLQIPEKMRQIIEKYELWLKIYKSWEYKKAQEVWNSNIWDPVSKMMSQRCDTILEWKANLNQGVFVMNHK